MTFARRHIVLGSGLIMAVVGAALWMSFAPQHHIAAVGCDSCTARNGNLVELRANLAAARAEQAAFTTDE